MIKGYQTFEDWKTDMDRFRANPNDKHLLAHVVRCVENSSKAIQKEVQEYLSGLTLESNPWIVFDQVAKENRNHKLFYKSKQDPWFNA